MHIQPTQQTSSVDSVSWQSYRSLVSCMPQEHYKNLSVHLEAQALAAAVPGVAELLEQESIDTEAGMLSGISQKHNMRSSPCRFTEFCNSQCLSHFAAPFIVVRTETSIAESCKMEECGHIVQFGDRSETRHGGETYETARTARCAGHSPSLNRPRASASGASMRSPSPSRTSRRAFTMV